MFRQSTSALSPLKTWMPATSAGMTAAKFGMVVAVDGNKLTIQFDKVGEKRVVDSFVERV
jgi:hypothetical protein